MAPTAAAVDVRSWEPFSCILDDAALTPGSCALRLFDSGAASADTKAFTV